jgi:hypothetical protein
MADVILKEITYKNFGKCIELSNDIVDLVTTIEIGPRIIRYGFIGCKNEFCDNSPETLKFEGEHWRLIGGHRLWHSPEIVPRTYMPDNDNVYWEKIGNGVRVINKIQKWVQIKKIMDIILSPVDSKVKIIHKLINCNAWPVELAAWALSVMAFGGKEIIPQPKNKSDPSDVFKGSTILTLWPFSKMNDPRVYWGDKYIILQLDKKIDSEIKFGISNEEGWAAYINNNHLFVKKYKHKHNARYPDGGVSYETYACDYMLEMESLSPLFILKPDDELVHIEEWEIFDEINMEVDNEQQINKIVSKYIDMNPRSWTPN